MSYNGKIVDFSKYELKKEVELSAEKVELGLSDDILKLISKAEGEIKEYVSSAKSISSLATKAITSGSDYIKTAVSLDKMLSEIKSKTTELGVNPNSVNGYKEASGLLVRYDPSAVQSKIADLRNF